MKFAKWLLTIVLLTVLALPAAAERRTALVIGNGAYGDAPLRNPVNDAGDMAAVLGELGFDVIHRKNATLRQMEGSLDEFWSSLKKGGVGLFYYAGHGLQVKGRNYLVPVDARIAVEQDVKYECLDAGKVLGRMEAAGNGLNLIILDACRNNPFARSWRSADRGLARMDAPSGSLIVFATAPGSVAADGGTRNGVFTEALLRHIRTPGIEIDKMMKRTRRDVAQATGQKQVPWESSSLMGEFYFVPRRTAAAAEASTALEAERKRIEAERERLEAEKRLLAEHKRLAEERRKIEEERQRLAKLRRELGQKGPATGRGQEETATSQAVTNADPKPEKQAETARTRPSSAADAAATRSDGDRIAHASGQGGRPPASAQQTEAGGRKSDAGPRLAYAPQTTALKKISLRSRGMNVTAGEIKRALERHGLVDADLNPHGTYRGELVDNGDGTVSDRTAGLMWQQAGSPRSMLLRYARRYVEKLNRDAFAGHSDWRMPTIEELASLIRPKSGERFMVADVFDKRQIRCWSADAPTGTGTVVGSTYGMQEQWIMSFETFKAIKGRWGQYAGSGPLGASYVRAVRSIEP